MKFFVAMNEAGIVRRVASVSDQAPAPAGYVEIALETFAAIKAGGSAGTWPRIVDGTVEWVEWSPRSLSAEAAARARRLARTADDGVITRARLLTIVRHLIGHSVALGYLVDPATPQAVKAEALGKERNIRQYLVGVLSQVDALQAVVTERKAAISAATTLSELRAVDVDTLGE